LLLIFGSPFVQELKFRADKTRGVKYQVQAPGEQAQEENPQKNRVKTIVPESTDFGIVIPKIGANAKIFPNVDPFDEEAFLPVLRRGVAHAQGTSFPGQGGNIYLFAHSTDAFYNVGRYNAVFYLLGKLDAGDEIDIFYHQKLYKYLVTEKKVVAPEAIEYFFETKKEVLTLQTCYPPGTTLKRMIIRAKMQD